MKISYSKFRIHLRHTFGISRSRNDWYDIAFIYIIDGNIIGRGEVAPSLRYNESIEKVLSILNKGIKLPKNQTDRGKIWDSIKPQLCGIKSLEAAFSMALWDWWSQLNKVPLYEILNMNGENLPLTSYTISIGNLNEIAEKVDHARFCSILKVKLGTPSLDKSIIKEIRNHTDKLIRVDANEGWDLETAIEMTRWLDGQNVEFIEQPFPANNLYQNFELKKKSPLEIIADETSLSSEDIPKIKHYFDGINIKLMKCGSIEEAQKMIKTAKSYGLKIMLGCMVESSLGITAAAHLSSDVDYADLDGNMLISNDPYEGIKIKNGQIVLNKKSGLGVTLKSKNRNLL